MTDKKPLTFEKAEEYVRREAEVQASQDSNPDVMHGSCPVMSATTTDKTCKTCRWWANLNPPSDINCGVCNELRFQLVVRNPHPVTHKGFGCIYREAKESVGKPCQP
jgi:hypothetical protein